MRCDCRTVRPNFSVSHGMDFKGSSRSSCCGAVEMNPARNYEVVGLIPGLSQWVKDLALLWLWCRPAAVAPVRPLAWEPPYAASAALKRQKTKRGGAVPKGVFYKHFRRLGVLLWCSGLRIWDRHCCGLGHCHGAGSIPGPGTSTCCGHRQEEIL